MADAFDFEVAMQNVDGDRQIMVELVNSMIEETPRLMHRIRVAISQHDREAVRREAHTLKSSVAMVGARAASAAASELESMSSDGDLRSFGPLHAELETRVDALLDALEKLCCDQGGSVE